MFCIKCGAQKQDGVKFCTQCGFGVGMPEMPHQKKKGRRKFSLSWRWKVFFLAAGISSLSGFTTLAQQYRGATTQSDASTVFAFIAVVSFLTLLPTFLRLLFRGGRLFFDELILRKKELSVESAKKALFAKFKRSRVRIAGNTVLIILLFAIPASFVSLYLASTESERPLESAMFYQGEYPEPKLVSVTDFGSGEAMEIYAFPGQIHLAVDPEMSIRYVSAAAEQRGGKIIAQLPVFGIYLIEVEQGQEATFIASLRDEPFVLNASPNAATNLSGTDVVDLSDKGKNVYDLIPALLSSSDPTAKIISAQIDDFLTSSHGDTVDAARVGITGNTPSMRVQVGRADCGRLLAALQGPGGRCGSGDASLYGLAAVIAGAQMNGQKIDINMSWGVSPKVQDPALYESALQPNSWAYQSVVNYEEQVLDIVAASKWAKEGNVLLNKAAGNGVTLLDAQNRLLREHGIDMAPALEAWKNHPQYKDVVDKNVIHYGALSADGNLEPYSNFGNGLVYATVPPRGGTSLAAPQGWGWSSLAWNENSILKSEDLAKAVQETATPNRRRLRVINPRALREMTSRTAASYRYQNPTDNPPQPPNPPPPPPGPQPPPPPPPPPPPIVASWDGVYATTSSGSCTVQVPGVGTVDIGQGLVPVRFEVRNNTIQGNTSINASGSARSVVSASGFGAVETYQFSHLFGGGASVVGSVNFSGSTGGGGASCNMRFSGNRVAP